MKAELEAIKEKDAALSAFADLLDRTGSVNDAVYVHGSTVVPVRFVSEALKAAVKWESETQSVVIYED